MSFNPNKILRYIRIRGRVIPIMKSSMPKIMYHQTTTEAKKSILKNGFNSKVLGNRASDILPDGIYLKNSSRDIGLKGKEQIPVLVGTKKTKYFQHREDYNDFMVKKSDKFTELLGKERRLDKVMSKRSDTLLDKLMNVRRKARANQLPSPPDQSLRMGKMDRHFYRWRQLGNDISKQVRNESSDLLQKDGFDSVSISRDQGSFGRSTDSFIVFDDKKVTPLKKLLRLVNREKIRKK